MDIGQERVKKLSLMHSTKGRSEAEGRRLRKIHGKLHHCKNKVKTSRYLKYMVQ